MYVDLTCQTSQVLSGGISPFDICSMSNFKSFMSETCAINNRDFMEIENLACSWPDSPLPLY